MLDKICNLTADDREYFQISDKNKYPTHYVDVCEEILQKFPLKPVLVPTFTVHDEFLET